MAETVLTIQLYIHDEPYTGVAASFGLNNGGEALQVEIAPGTYKVHAVAIDDVGDLICSEPQTVTISPSADQNISLNFSSSMCAEENLYAEGPPWIQSGALPTQKFVVCTEGDWNNVAFPGSLDCSSALVNQTNLSMKVKHNSYDHAKITAAGNTGTGWEVCAEVQQDTCGGSTDCTQNIEIVPGIIEVGRIFSTSIELYTGTTCSGSPFTSYTLPSGFDREQGTLVDGVKYHVDSVPTVRVFVRDVN